MISKVQIYYFLLNEQIYFYEILHRLSLVHLMKKNLSLPRDTQTQDTT